MTLQQRRVNQYLQHYAKQIQTAFSLKNGVCALYDAKGDKAVVIEVPSNGDHVFFYCPVPDLHQTASAGFLSQLLLLNFDMETLQGSWFALDDDQVCLCRMLVIETTDQAYFCHTLASFVEQVRQVRVFLRERGGQEMSSTY